MSIDLQGKIAPSKYDKSLVQIGVEERRVSRKYVHPRKAPSLKCVFGIHMGRERANEGLILGQLNAALYAEEDGNAGRARLFMQKKIQCRLPKAEISGFADFLFDDCFVIEAKQEKTRTWRTTKTQLFLYMHALLNLTTRPVIFGAVSDGITWTFYELWREHPTRLVVVADCTDHAEFDYHNEQDALLIRGIIHKIVVSYGVHADTPEPIHEHDTGVSAKDPGVPRHPSAHHRAPSVA